MLKNTLLSVVTLVAFTSCYSMQGQIGSGAQGNSVKSSKNHYAVYGLAPIKVVTPEKLANGATDYDYKIEHSFIDGLVSGLTFGLYNPTTTTVTQ